MYAYDRLRDDLLFNVFLMLFYAVMGVAAPGRLLPSHLLLILFGSQTGKLLTMLLYKDLRRAEAVKQVKVALDAVHAGDELDAAYRSLVWPAVLLMVLVIALL